MGTVDYASPEQIEGKPLDGRADVYSLGCVIYECLTGTSAFDKDSEVALMYAHLLEPPPAVTDKRPDLPAEIDDVIATAMAKSKDERYETPKQLAAALSRVLGAVGAGQAMDAPATVLAPALADTSTGLDAPAADAVAPAADVVAPPATGPADAPPAAVEPSADAVPEAAGRPPRSRRPIVLIGALARRARGDRRGCRARDEHHRWRRRREASGRDDGHGDRTPRFGDVPRERRRTNGDRQHVRDPERAGDGRGRNGRLHDFRRRTDLASRRVRALVLPEREGSPGGVRACEGRSESRPNAETRRATRSGSTRAPGKRAVIDPASSTTATGSSSSGHTRSSAPRTTSTRWASLASRAARRRRSRAGGTA